MDATGQNFSRQPGRAAHEKHLRSGYYGRGLSNQLSALCLPGDFSQMVTARLTPEVLAKVETSGFPYTDAIALPEGSFEVRFVVNQDQIPRPLGMTNQKGTRNARPSASLRAGSKARLFHRK